MIYHLTKLKLDRNTGSVYYSKRIPKSNVRKTLYQRIKLSVIFYQYNTKKPAFMASFLNAADRKRMEQERLARLGLDKTEPSDNQKRRREDSGSSSAQDSLKKPKVSEVIDLCSDSDDDIELAEPSISSRCVPTNLKFREGLVGLTAAAFSDRTDRIKFKDLIDANHLRRALLSSFVWEDDWLFQHVPADIPICLVRTEPFSLEPVPSNIKIVNPPMLQNRGCMHVKLLVLFFDEYVRIVITSANLIAIHWDNGMENVIFVQDFPRHDGPITSPISSQFQLHLIQFLTALTVPSQVMDRLKGFDFSQAQVGLSLTKLFQPLCNEPCRQNWLLQSRAQSFTRIRFKAPCLPMSPAFLILHMVNLRFSKL
ncbi:hypothetical protein BKA69DRAFT_45662 [Paraphysoderma sedebokerense]|nr:hypothetical protein BKA69DRAFT_45662 [Paraphysoderma sedebokerense]